MALHTPDSTCEGKSTLFLMWLTVALGLVLASTIAYADVPSGQKPEVAHLLNFVRNTNCIIERNGTKYDGEEAYSHIMNKYEYFRDDIKSTEDFIEYSATKSTMSGDVYLVHCVGQAPKRTSDWLLQELSRLRKGKPTKTTKQ
jgi:hypothetical protein